MTFKHIKFEDSYIMRSLEKVAVEKGLVKPQSLQKQAAVIKKADITPTSSLMENIFKLSTGLREQGLMKEASELEVNYFNYRQAQNLSIYETSTEKGEDLIGAAHPKGSHKLEGIDAEEAVVEDILDQHLKMMRAIEKTPSGKLEASARIINSVKIALGYSKEQVLSYVKRYLVKELYDASAEITGVIQYVEKNGYSADKSADNLRPLDKEISKWVQIINTGSYQGVKPAAWHQFGTDLQSDIQTGASGPNKQAIRACISNAQALSANIRKIPETELNPLHKDNALKKMNAIISTIKGLDLVVDEWHANMEEIPSAVKKSIPTSAPVAQKPAENDVQKLATILKSTGSYLTTLSQWANLIKDKNALPWLDDNGRRVCLNWLVNVEYKEIATEQQKIVPVLNMFVNPATDASVKSSYQERIAKWLEDVARWKTEMSGFAQKALHATY